MILATRPICVFLVNAHCRRRNGFRCCSYWRGRRDIGFGIGFDVRLGIGFGGLFRLGEKQYPLPWNELTYDTSRGGYVIANPPQPVAGC